MAKRKKKEIPEAETREYVRRYVTYGFYQSDGIARIVGEDMSEGAFPEGDLQKIIAEEIKQKRVEERSWPTVTDCDRLDEVFTSLTEGGILALHNAGNTPSEGIDEMSEQYYAAGGEASCIRGYCFYHRQDMEYALKFGELSLAFGDINGDDQKGVQIGRKVRQALKAGGFKVAWTGSVEDKLNIKGFRWQRRSRRREKSKGSGFI